VRSEREAARLSCGIAEGLDATPYAINDWNRFRRAAGIYVDVVFWQRNFEGLQRELGKSEKLPS